MKKPSTNSISRREMFSRVGEAAAVAPILQTAILSSAAAEGSTPLNAQSGIDRVTIMPGKTYLRGWAGYGEAPRPERAAPRDRQPEAPPATGPAFATLWNKASGPGEVKFADPKAAITTATFSAPGDYVLRFLADNGDAKSASTLRVSVEPAPPARQLDAVYTRNFKIHSKFWNARAKALILNWIPHCIDVVNSDHVILGPGGIDNFVEAGKKLRGEPAGHHKGYVFSNAWVHQTVEAMSIC